MSLDWLLVPVEDALPCGSDLAAIGDEAFDAYYYEAESRLPERYFIPGHADAGGADRLFDPRSVALGAESAAITRLLKRSRDLRLLGLWARFQILAGRLPDFTDSLEAMAALVTKWPAETHPVQDRRAAIEVLAEPATVIMPLQYFPLVPNTNATLRQHMIAEGRIVPRQNEEGPEGQDILSPLRANGQKPALARTQDMLNRALSAVAVLSSASALASGGAPPDLNPLRQVLADMQAMIAEVAPELAAWQPAATLRTDMLPPQPQEDTPAAAPALPEAVTSRRNVPDRAAASAALLAAERYLAERDPSSPVLLLVVQARQLVGMSLVGALEMLMPAQAAQATLAVGHGSGFHLPMERLKALGPQGHEVARPHNSAVPVIADRAELGAWLAGVEDYYQRHEPASPIPLLLIRARELSGKGFGALVAELFPGVAKISEG
ncbi:MAG: type VI secretion system ImpA family N-terminal domain-containing protein [Paracoccus sp. (in: a-proteobacteria)]|uniref:type VI secretion system protein TssA n=1 Tax=Paracoccus sp. TaxID=267 RepID=UPI0026DEF116|nr:type VI secretion system ImpA family N-terminal domain-containing protein [Paracoccus sp. (in: a-proteobacteria)]MDO5622766.1 type VI secretion system ImpA family N-terminal domain-containing protein [Paracoccus sp. (in: a-proteobacteria)]